MDDLRTKFGDRLFEKRHRRGYNHYEAHKIIRERNYFASMMVEEGYADAMISGLTRKYADTIRPGLEIIGTSKKGRKVSSMYMMLTKKGPLFFADTTIISNPTVDELVDITFLTAQTVRSFNIEPKVALLSYSNFGSSDEEEPRIVREAMKKINALNPDFIVDGEIQANFAFSSEALKENYPFSKLVNNPPNVLIFPNLSAANIAYKLLQSMNTAEAVGPILMGMNKPVHILQLGSSVREILNMVTIATIDAQQREKIKKEALVS